MTDAARHVLNEACLTNNLPLDGWEHVYTGINDDGQGVFVFDHEDGRVLHVTRRGDQGDLVEVTR